MLVEEQPEPVSEPSSVEAEKIVEQPDVTEQPTIIHETEPENMPEPEPQQPCESRIANKNTNKLYDYKDILSMDWCSTRFCAKIIENSEVVTINKVQSGFLCSV